MYEKIILATMGEYMDELIEHTVDLLHGRDAEVLCVYVVETSVPFLTPKKVKEMMIDELTKKGKEILDDVGKAFSSLNYPNIKFSGIMLEGKPAEEIVKIAEDEKADVIVLGTGKSLVDKHLLGSVSEKIVHYAPCTIHLV
ncbi:MAG: universal stress protein, partial [Methanobacteriaceae archaeon]|nr:universal stress protein [Methanobacteriaceae archaeon]